MEGKGKKSNIKCVITFVMLGVFLLACLIGGLAVWYVFYPAFKDLILCLGIIGSLVVVYFAILRGVFLNKNSGYSIDNQTIVIKDGYPNSKKHIIKTSQISNYKIREYKFAYLICAICVFAVGIIATIVVAVLLKLEATIIVIIILVLILICGYFVALHFLSVGLATLKIVYSEKRVSLKNVKKDKLYDIVTLLQRVDV